MEAPEKTERGNLPHWMKVYWFVSAPFSVLLAVRVMWEKTVWTWIRGPQMVGFSLLHVHPLFAIAEALSVLGIFVWSLIAVVLIAMRRKHVSRGEVGMLLCAVLIIVAMVLPDTLFAHVR